MKMEGLPLHLCHSHQFSLPAVYLFLIITICLAPPSRTCPAAFHCGGHLFEYPFGAKNSGCGDPSLQLDCDHELGMPLINISGYQYYVVTPFEHLKEDPLNNMTILDKNLGEDTCNPLTSKHTMELWSSLQFRISDECMNISLWGKCGEEIKVNLSIKVNTLHCNDSWYYSSTSNSILGTHCKSLVQLPIKNSYTTNRSLDRREDRGFRVKWHFSKGCEQCDSIKETCIYDIKNPTQLSCELLSPGANKTAIATNQKKIKTAIATNQKKIKTAIALGISFGGLALITLLAMLYILYLKRRKQPHCGDFNNYQRSNMEVGHPKYMIGSLSIFPYQELQQATNFFDKKMEVGDGGFGVVYLGKLEDGQAVAVKRLYQESPRTIQQFINEIQILSSLCHPNLVRLYGCTGPVSPVLLLVYEFVPNGTLFDHLHGSRKIPRGLPWAIRLSIAIEATQALAYLHSIDPPIFHRDVKSSNILLDESFRAKVTDFGLSKLVPVNVSHVTTAPQGTPGYVDPEYHQCFHLTEKSDVYSLGVVLVEIISAKVAVDITRNTNEISLANMATDKIRRGVLDELVDLNLKIERNHEVKVMVAAVAELAFQCLAIQRDFRPTMKEVVGRLIEIKEMLQETIESSKSISISPTTSLQEN